MQQKIGKQFLSGVLLALFFCGSAAAAQSAALIPIGHTVGIQMQADGVLVVKLTEIETATGAESPARAAGLQEGDVIVAVGERHIGSNDDLQKAIALGTGESVAVEVRRDGLAKRYEVRPCTDASGTYRIGVLARDSMAGIGTLTYVDPASGAYGSLGHAICESETGTLLPLAAGSLIRAEVGAVEAGRAGEPGALQGTFDDMTPIGSVERNTEQGIFGMLYDDTLYHAQAALPIADFSEIQPGAAEIYCNVAGDAVAPYAVTIEKVFTEEDAANGMVLCVTDEKLKAQTGGIVQGMSGSPIVQNGKLVGAVTHVLVNDPTRGYGIYIGDMLEAAG